MGKLIFDTDMALVGCGDVHERLFMYSLITMMQAKTLVEMGVAGGDGIYWLAKAAQETGGHVHGFDCWRQHGAWNQFEQMGSKQQVEERLHRAGLSNFSLHQVDTGASDFDLASYISNEIDFASIDGDHSYQGVKADFEQCSKRLSKRGIIILHDCLIIDGVRQYMLELEQSNKWFMHTLPYGAGTRRSGVTIMQRKISTGVPMDEICGAPLSKDEIYANEIEYWGFPR